jgi:hypothetical protein
METSRTFSIVLEYFLKKRKNFVNNLINKTKALLVQDVVAPSYPKVKYKDIRIDFVQRFKYLGVDITTKLGWGIYIQNRIKKISKIYHALHILFKKIPISLIKIRRKLFFCLCSSSHNLAIFMLVLLYRSTTKVDRTYLLHWTTYNVQS